MTSHKKRSKVIKSNQSVDCHKQTRVFTIHFLDSPRFTEGMHRKDTDVQANLKSFLFAHVLGSFHMMPVLSFLWRN